ncbi:hypothetical protein HOB87_12280 [Candidatus Woesearchaeota archaeon]|jgi:hypothetical protein|nr:hypothetical protein [Candidatus Woesearchaeota archaeon]
MPIAIIYTVVVMLFIGVLPLPYGYYTLLRLVACGAFGYSAYIAHTRKSKNIPWIYGILAVLFNPIIKIYLPKECWIVVDIGAGILLLATNSKIKS